MIVRRLIQASPLLPLSSGVSGIRFVDNTDVRTLTDFPDVEVRPRRCRV
jgi:hypothetical protein